VTLAQPSLSASANRDCNCKLVLCSDLANSPLFFISRPVSHISQGTIAELRLLLRGLLALVNSATSPSRTYRATSRISDDSLAQTTPAAEHHWIVVPAAASRKYLLSVTGNSRRVARVVVSVDCLKTRDRGHHDVRCSGAGQHPAVYAQPQAAWSVRIKNHQHYCTLHRKHSGMCRRTSGR
jgi:hypothetical protein